LITAWFFALAGSLGTVYWLPTFVKRLSGLPDRSVTSLLLIPAVIGITSTLFNGWHSDKHAERRWHTAIPLFAAALMYALIIPARHDLSLAIPLLLVAGGIFYGYYPTFWAMPTMILSESAAAATFGLINSVGQLAGFGSNYTIGFLNDRTHSLTASLGFLALVFVTAGCLILTLKIQDPLAASKSLDPQTNGQSESEAGVAAG
jgi:ACS family tartrate transporter-like MFS transporter